MGYMRFKKEGVGDCARQGERGDDLVARFGAWLTEDGASTIAMVVCAISAVGELADLLDWLIGNFQKCFFTGLVSVVGAMFMVALSAIPICILYVVVYGIGLAAGWMCYNKWTLAAGFAIAAIGYFLLQT